MSEYCRRRSDLHRSSHVANIDEFAIDKALNTLVEEGIAPLYIRGYYRLQGRKMVPLPLEILEEISTNNRL